MTIYNLYITIFLDVMPMPMTGKEMVKALQKIGFKTVRINGSHYLMKRGDEVETVPVHGNKDLSRGVEQSLKKKWGLQ